MSLIGRFIFSILAYPLKCFIVFRLKNSKNSQEAKETAIRIQLFRERLSEKVHATIPKGIVGGFEFTVLQRNLKEWHERPWTYVCEC